MIETITTEQFASDTVDIFDLIKIVDFDGFVLEYSTAELIIENGMTLAHVARGLARELGDGCKITRESFPNHRRYTIDIIVK